MIRLIATDLDGTLLDDQKRIHPDFWELHQQLIRQGIVFVAASGRQYYTIYEQFSHLGEEIIILAENGTFVKQGERELLVNDLPLSDARYFIEKARQVDGVDVILCGKESAYVESNHKEFRDDAALYYLRLQHVKDLCEVEDTILKVTLWDHKGAENNSWPRFRSYESDFKVALAGDRFLDITNSAASKGTSIGWLQEKLNISPDETLIFGDYLNDLDMMGMGKYSYAMKNAHPRIIEIAKSITQYDNNSNGVVRTIRELFAEMGLPLASADARH